MVLLFSISTGLLSGMGLYFLLADRLHLPTAAASSACIRLARRTHPKPSLTEAMLGDFSIWLSGHLRLGTCRREQLQSDLQAAGLSVSPELHMARSITRALPCALLALPAAPLLPVLVPPLLLLSFLLYRQAFRGLSEQMQEKRRKIEYELPRFVSYIEKSLRHSRDVLGILDGYRKNAGPDLGAELEITAADMRSGHAEAALTRLEARVGSSLLSDTARGLLGVLRGDETAAYWTSLSMKCTEYQRQLLRAEAHRIPAKVRRLSLYLLLCLMLVYLTVIGMQIYLSLGGLFG